MKDTENQSQLQDKLRSAYREGRDFQELVEIELSHAKIMLIQEDGKRLRVPVLTCH
ncbi:hypothetical protein QWZ04_13395 [Vibrio tapetis subsp. quintayensis]|uniref:hypothetical protein n=1 Tax=Vibrio tapetis TaxID=52443 RepID=UPI0025B3040E|nr:hypothetical protein [Vibrio tapetis]MDN3681317.1 hypothetical protein [Vibrio tapetis subsp. quintayensis]